MNLHPALSDFVELLHKFSMGANRQYGPGSVLEFHRARYGLSSFTRNFTYLVDATKVVRREFAEALRGLDIGLECVEFYHGFYYLKDGLLMMFSQLSSTSASINLTFVGDKHYVDLAMEVFKRDYPKRSIKVHVAHIERNEINSKPVTIEVPSVDDIAPKANYPYLKHDAVELSQAFFDSPSNVMVLIGPPGTGKSTFMRAMLFQGSETNREIYVVNSDHVIDAQDFDAWINQLPSAAMIVIEDADRLVSKRTDGNKSMAMLLNYADGVIPSKRKFIISTNLSSTSKIDEALIRPGRCFDVLGFRKLHHAEANEIYLARNPNAEPIPDTGDLSLSEVLNYNSDVETRRRTTNFGFNAS